MYYSRKNCFIFPFLFYFKAAESVRFHARQSSQTLATYLMF